MAIFLATYQTPSKFLIQHLISTYNEYLSIYFDKSTTELTGKNVGQELAQFTIEQLSKLENNTKRDQI